jgi:hypothetical protein
MLPALALASLIVSARPAFAQQRDQWFSFDSVVSIDEFGGQNAASEPQIIVDVSSVARISDHVQMYLRPWFRLPRPNEPGGPVPAWVHELYQAGVRYERPAGDGRPAVRADVGLNLSPIGLGVLDIRPSANPTIAPHLSYLVPMPAFDPTVPRVGAIAASYPLGGQVTLSGAHWDTRAALLNSAPTRVYALERPGAPRQTPVLVAGGGVTPTIGLRFGLSLARGDYATADEVTGPVRTARAVTIFGGEGEYAFGFTKISGEILRSRFDRLVGSAVAYEWFVQGTQTISPRWFVAAREESTLAPPLITASFTGPAPRFDAVETTAGFRLTKELTLRSSFYMRRSYGASAWDRQAAVSAVWARRWW